MRIKFNSIGQPSDNIKNSLKIKVMSYNILADAYCNNYMFPYARRGTLNFKFRSTRIIEEIRSSNSDIICLQVFPISINQFTLIGSRSLF